MNDLSPESIYWLSLIFIIVGSLGVGGSFGYLQGWHIGFHKGFRSCSTIWNDEDGDDEGGR